MTVRPVIPSSPQLQMSPPDTCMPSQTPVKAWRAVIMGQDEDEAIQVAQSFHQERRLERQHLLHSWLWEDPAASGLVRSLWRLYSANLSDKHMAVSVCSQLADRPKPSAWKIQGLVLPIRPVPAPDVVAQSMRHQPLHGLQAQVKTQVI